MGEGAARTYVELTSNGHLVAIGVAFSEGMLEGLPAKINQAGRCFDVDGDGSFQAATECMGDYALNLFFPEELIRGSGYALPVGGCRLESERASSVVRCPQRLVHTSFRLSLLHGEWGSGRADSRWTLWILYGL